MQKEEGYAAVVQIGVKKLMGRIWLLRFLSMIMIAIGGFLIGGYINDDLFRHFLSSFGEVGGGFAFVGGIFLAFGLFMLTITGQWAKRLIWITHNTVSETLPTSFRERRSMDSTEFYVDIRSEDRGCGWQFKVWFHNCQMSELIGACSKCPIFFDPKTNLPVAAIVPGQGILWALKGSSMKIRP